MKTLDITIKSFDPETKTGNIYTSSGRNKQLDLTNVTLDGVSITDLKVGKTFTAFFNDDDQLVTIQMWDLLA